MVLGHGVRHGGVKFKSRCGHRNTWPFALYGKKLSALLWFTMLGSGYGVTEIDSQNI